MNRRSLIAGAVAAACAGSAKAANVFFFRAATGATGQSGQLAAGHWVPAKMTLTSSRIVHPRPDGETGSTAWHRNAHANIPYQCPIMVQGGAYPFWYEIISAPAGATVGQFYNSTDYGVVNWTPTSGTQNFTIRVHDQDGVTVDVSWSVVVGTSWVFFVDSVNGNDTTGTGLYAAPWATYSKACSTVSGGKAVCFRTGTYTPVAGGQNLSSSGHNTLFGYPGETATFNCAVTNTTQGLWNETSADSIAANLSFTGALLGTNPRHFSNFALADRFYKWRCTFSDSGGSSGTDNSACWFLGDPGGQRNYIGLHGCNFSNLPGSSSGYMIIDTYQTKYVVMSSNVLGANLVPEFLFFPKGAGVNDVSITANTWASPSASSIDIHLGTGGSTGTPAPNNVEMRYNTIVSTNTSNDHSTVAVVVNLAQNNSNAATVWSYRNTIVGLPTITYQSVNVLTFTSDNDVITHDATTSGLVGKWIAVWDNDGATVTRNPTTVPSIVYTINGVECQGDVSAAILDGSYKLQGSYRATYLGLRGAEIA